MARSHEIAQRIEKELARGTHGQPGERFMTVRQLAARYGVSIVTAQKVVRRLKDRGLLIGDSTNPPLIGPGVAGRKGGDSGRPRRLGMIVTNIANPFFSRLCRQVQQAAAAGGYQVLVAGTQYDFPREKKAVDSFLEIGVEGLLIVPGLDDACLGLYQGLIERGLRLVFISRQVEKVAADFVVADSFAAGAAMAGHLLSMGYESFGYIGFGARIGHDARLSGFRSALRDAGATLDSERIVRGEGGADGYSAMARLMRGKGRPRAVFAFHDLLAIGALRYCEEHGIPVPQQVAIAGFDNLPESQVTSPPLTTVAYPVEAMARLAMQCLTGERTDDPRPRPSRHIYLEPHLIVRGSTDPSARLAGPVVVAGLESYDL